MAAAFAPLTAMRSRPNRDHAQKCFAGRARHGIALTGVRTRRLRSGATLCLRVGEESVANRSRFAIGNQGTPDTGKSEGSPSSHGRPSPHEVGPFAMLIADTLTRLGISDRKAAALVTDAAWELDKKTTTVHASAVSRWKSGTVAQPDMRRWIAHGLNIPPGEVHATADEQRKRRRLPPPAGAAVSPLGRSTDMSDTRPNEHGSVEADNMSTVERRDFLKRAAEVGFLGLVPDQLARLVTSIALETRTHVASAELSNVGTMTLEQVALDFVRLSRSWVTRPRLAVFAELVELRDRIYGLLNGNQSAGQTADLYLVAGQTCGLLASASLSAANPTAAAIQAHSAYAYGQFIGHNDLRAFGRAMQSLIAYWSDDYNDAIQFARSGHGFADSPDVQARLMALEARALAKLGNARDVPPLLSRALEVMERADASVQQGSNGWIAFTAAKLNCYVASAFADLGLHGDAITHGERSIRLAQATPHHLRAYRDEADTYVTLAEASISKGSIDGAAARLAPLFTHPQRELMGDDQPTNRRFDGLRAQLRDVRRSGADARELAERIDAFLAALAAIPE
jgi:hypothetical protein